MRSLGDVITSQLCHPGHLRCLRFLLSLWWLLFRETPLSPLFFKSWHNTRFSSQPSPCLFSSFIQPKIIWALITCTCQLLVGFQVYFWPVPCSALRFRLPCPITSGFLQFIREMVYHWRMVKRRMPNFPPLSILLVDLQVLDPIGHWSRQPLLWFQLLKDSGLLSSTVPPALGAMAASSCYWSVG